MTPAVPAFPIATLTFFGLLVLVFAGQLALAPGSLVVPPGLAFMPGALFGGADMPIGVLALPPPATLVSYQFLHGGWPHLLGNLLFLRVFGPRVEGSLGPARFTVLLILAGIAAGLAQAWPDPSSPVAMVGASGGISGVLGAHLWLHPRARLRMPLGFGSAPRTLDLPAYLVLIIWFGSQLLLSQLHSSWTETVGGGTAFPAHIGGFLAGVLLAPVLDYSLLFTAEARPVAGTPRSRDSRH